MTTAEKQRKTIFTIAFIVLIVLAVIIFAIYQGGYKNAEEKYLEEISRLEAELANRVNVYEEVSKEVDISMIEEQIHNIGELATIEYLYTDAGRFSETNQLFGVDIGITEKSFIAKWDGSIKAGINIENIKLTYNKISKTITVSIPAAEILSHELDENSIETLDEKDGLFNPLKVEDVRVFDAESKAAMEKRAIDNGLLEKAETNAKNIIYELIKSNPDLKDYKIEFDITN